ncbi:MAG: hypothetical protein CVV24_12755 [Ignavibacteriae bacterium HGW-Ignavibacteriae-3]|nr:MAG: hypothetical protein CVV24_12755 [Ignavibacteriae bacterium HGW-Ignavibacteriae-3]
MKIQCKTVFNFSFFTTFLSNIYAHSSKLALPINNLAIISENLIIFYYLIGHNTPFDNLTVSINPKLKFRNNRSLIINELKKRKI